MFFGEMRARGVVQSSVWLSEGLFFLCGGFVGGGNALGKAFFGLCDLGTEWALIIPLFWRGRNHPIQRTFILVEVAFLIVRRLGIVIIARAAKKRRCLGRL